MWHTQWLPETLHSVFLFPNKIELWYRFVTKIFFDKWNYMNYNLSTLWEASRLGTVKNIVPRQRYLSFLPSFTFHKIMLIFQLTQFKIMNGTGNKYATTGKNKPADVWMHFIYGKEKALSDNSEIKYKEELRFSVLMSPSLFFFSSARISAYAFLETIYSIYLYTIFCVYNRSPSFPDHFLQSISLGL